MAKNVAAYFFAAGASKLVGVPFNIPADADNNAWTAAWEVGDSPILLDIDVEVFGASDVFTFINTSWGNPARTATPLSNSTVRTGSISAKT